LFKFSFHSVLFIVTLNKKQEQTKQNKIQKKKKRKNKKHTNQKQTNKKKSTQKATKTRSIYRIVIVVSAIFQLLCTTSSLNMTAAANLQRNLFKPNPQ
jgi:predicted histidine transporter YuiF (NhaC family)